MVRSSIGNLPHHPRNQDFPMVMKDKNQLLRKLPKVDECLARLEPHIAEYGVPPRIAKTAVQQTVEQVRSTILNDEQVQIPANEADWDKIFKKRFNPANTGGLL